MMDLYGRIGWGGLQSHGPKDGSVRAAELVGKGFFFGRDKFVAGGEDGEAGMAGDFELGGSNRSSESEVGGGEDGSGAEEFLASETIGALAVDEDAGGGAEVRGDGDVGFGEGEFFHWNDGVAIGRHQCAGHDLPAVAGLEGFGCRGAGGVKSLHGERAEGEFVGAAGDAIHGDAVVGRKVAVGGEGLAQGATEGVFERDDFAGKRGKGFGDELVGLGRGDEWIHAAIEA